MLGTVHPHLQDFFADLAAGEIGQEKLTFVHSDKRFFLKKLQAKQTGKLYVFRMKLLPVVKKEKRTWMATFCTQSFTLMPNCEQICDKLEFL